METLFEQSKEGNILYIGVDPGEKGSISFMVEDTPLTAIPTNLLGAKVKRKRLQKNRKYKVTSKQEKLEMPERFEMLHQTATMVLDIVKNYSFCVVLIEHVDSIFGQKTNGKLLRNHGKLVGVFEALKVMFQGKTEIIIISQTPTEWQKYLDLGTDGKDSKDILGKKCEELFPNLYFRYKKDREQFADSLLLAYLAKTAYNSISQSARKKVKLRYVEPKEYYRFQFKE